MQDKALAMLGMATKAGKSSQRRIFRGKGCQRRQGMAGAGCRRCI